MTNKQIRGGLCLLMAAMVCFAAPCMVYGDSADAVFVEENAVIGGDMGEEGVVTEQLQQTEAQPQQEGMQSQQSVVQSPQSGEQLQRSKTPKTDREQTAEEALQVVKEESVSQNSQPKKTLSGNTFSLPQSKSGDTMIKGTENRRTNTLQEAEGSTELTREERNISKEIKETDETDKVSLPLLLTGVMCLGAGIARIIRRLLVAYGKL